MAEKLNLEAIRKKVVPVLKKKNVKKAGIFGSYASGRPKKNSDVDILIEFNGSLLELIRLEIELRKVLKKKVDLLTYNGINPLIRKRILKEEVKVI